MWPAFTTSISPWRDGGGERSRSRSGGGLFAFGPVMLVHACGQFVEWHAGHGHGPEGGAEAGGHDGRSQAFAGHVGNGNEQAAVRLLDDIEVIAAHLIAVTDLKLRVALDRGQRLRKSER